METSTENKSSDELTIRDCFDRVFYQHMDRLIGSHYGIEGLPLNLVNVTCLILLTEQLTYEMESSTIQSERHTRGSLFQELSEMGLTLAEDTDAILEDIIQKGYVEVGEMGTLTAQKPTIKMAQLLDRTFPKMPGLNLIASLAQPIDEIRSGRKDLETGLRFFDQILKMQGVTLAKQKAQAPPPGVARKESEEPSPSRGTNVSMQNLQRRKLSDIYQLRALRGPQSPASFHAPENESQILPSEQVEIKEIALSEPLVSEEQPQETHGFMKARLSENTQESSSETTTFVPIDAQEGPVDVSGDMDDRVTSYAGKAAEESPVHHPVPSTWELSSSEPMSETIGLEYRNGLQETENDWESETPETEDPIEDDDVEERIRNFEQNLSLQCPLCKTGVIRHETTSTGKVFYKCSESDCNFISWGKPHHILCPQCQNPFLVEIHRPNSGSMLKCPRATCTYWQDYASDVFDQPNGETPTASEREVKVRTVVRRPKKRVVRRRVVRRKSS